MGAGIIALPPGSQRTAGSVSMPAKAEKLRIAVIGVGGRGADNLQGVAGEQIVALCDVDRGRLNHAASQHPDAHLFADYREVLALDSLDAVVISTPDHSHAPAAALALKAGLDVYCEKPLTHDIYEARRLAQLAVEHSAVTQMGTQIHSWDNYRRVVERVQAGQLGPVREVHVFVNGKAWAGTEMPRDKPAIPADLDWDLWLGPAAERDYHPSYHPAGWRRYWAFGGGTMADMACHYMDLAYWALDLRYPQKIRADGPGLHPELTPAGLRVHYEFPARGSLPGLTLSWYDGDRKPEVLAELGLEEWQNGVLFVGDEGHLIADYTKLAMGPGRLSEMPAPPEFVPKSIGHYQEWIQACKTRGVTSCDFAYSGPLTEAVLLGNLAYRSGKELEWDARGMRVLNQPALDSMIRVKARDGWSFLD